MSLRLALAALASVTFAAGCAVEPVAAEGQGETASHQTTSDGQKDAFLSKMETAAKRCEMPREEDMEAVEAMVPPTFKLNGEAYVYVSCTISNGKLLTASVTMEDRIGYSTEDGVFTEQASSATAALEFKVGVAELSAGLTKEFTTRATIKDGALVSNKGSSTSVGVGVKRDLVVGEVSGEASYDIESGTGTISGGGAIKLPIPSAKCNGTQAVGFKVNLSISGNEWDARAKRADAVLRTMVQNNDAIMSTTSKHPDAEDMETEFRAMCCEGTKKKGLKARTC